LLFFTSDAEKAVIYITFMAFTLLLLPLGN